jgi:predicted DNA-binding transcriptional regulator YafY
VPAKVEHRNVQIVRVLGVLRLLERVGGVDLHELARRFGTDQRTIRRDLAALQDAGIPIEEDSREGKRKRWRVSGVHLSKLLGSDHYLALRIAMAQAGAVPTRTTHFAALEDLAGKIERAIGERGRRQLEEIDRCFYSYEKRAYLDAPLDLLLPTIRAIVSSCVCSVTYRAPSGGDREKTFEILPLKLFVHDGAVYLMASPIKYGGVATLNMQRVRGLKLLDRHAEPPPEFDPERLENAAFGIYTGGEATRYRLRFSGDVAPYIRERIWHPSQVLSELRDGGVEIEFTCGASYEVSAWVASWRAAVTVLEPESLRVELAALGSYLTRTYRRPPRMKRRSS